MGHFGLHCESNKCVSVRAGKPHPLRRVWVWLELLDGCCVAIFAIAYFPMRARSSGVKEVVYLLAFLHSLSAARLSLPGSPLGVRWETAAFGLPLVGSSLG